MEDCLAKVSLAKRSSLYADKGYFGKPNEEILLEVGLKSRIQSKALKNNLLSSVSKKTNCILIYLNNNAQLLIIKQDIYCNNTMILS